MKNIINLNNSSLHLTSVNVDRETFNKFITYSKENNISITKLVNRAMDLYMKDKDFKLKIDNNISLILKNKNL